MCSSDLQAGWRKVIALAVTNGIPAQGFSAAMAYYDGYRSADLPANLLKANEIILARILTSVKISRAVSFTI